MNLSRKVRCIRWKPKEVGKGNVESCRKKSRYGDQVAVLVPLVVEVRSSVGVVGDDVSLVNKTLDLDVGFAGSRRCGVENWYPGWYVISMELLRW